MTKTPPRPEQRANKILSSLLWERKFKKKKQLTIVNGGVMNQIDFEKYSTIAKNLTNAKQQ